MKLEPNQELFSNCCHGNISSTWPESDICPECHDHCAANLVTFDDEGNILEEKEIK